MSDVAIKTPAHIAAAIAGGTIGITDGFMTKGEELERSGATLSNQFTGGLKYGLETGIRGAAIGGGAAIGLSVAKSILKK